MEPLITTVIPTYQRPNRLRRAIQSVLNQTYPHFQVHVYDNSSGDETPEVVAEFASRDSRVRYHCHRENIGAIPNFMHGVSQVATPYFHILSDDDLVLPGFFEIAMRALEETAKAICFAGATIHADEDGNVWSMPLSSWREGLYEPPNGFLEMLRKGHPEWTGMMFRREVLTRVGFVDPEIGMVCDLDFELRVSARFPVFVSRRPCALLMQHAASASARRTLDSVWPGRLKMLRSVDALEDLPNDVKSEACEIIRRMTRARVLACGFKAAIDRRIPEALYASGILGAQFNRPLLARLIRAAVSNQRFGGCLRLALRLAIATRREVRRACVPAWWAGRYRIFVREGLASK